MREQVVAIKEWQLENGLDGAPFATELHEAFLVLSLIPGVGSPYRPGEFPGLRRLFLKGIASHLYYTFTEDEVIVRGLWHTSRGHGPDLG